MSGREINYYVDGNTVRGYHNFIDSNLQCIDSIIRLNGDYGVGKALIVKKLGEEWIERGYDIELIKSSLSSGCFNGIIIPEFKLAILSDSEIQLPEVENTFTKQEGINLTVACDIFKMLEYKDEALKIKICVDKYLDKADDSFISALKQLDQWEKLWIDNIDLRKLNRFVERFAKHIFKNKHLEKRAVNRYRFTKTGDELAASIGFNTDNVLKRYFIKDYSGICKAIVLNKLISSSEERGFDVEVYYDNLDPANIDILVIKELNIVVFDVTNMQKYSSSEIIDLYSEAVNTEIGSDVERRLTEIITNYKESIKQAVEYLGIVGKYNDELNSLYLNATNFEVMNKVIEDINFKIERIAEAMLT